MRLSINDKNEIKQIIAGFTDADYQEIDKEVERLCATAQPLFNLLEDHKPDEHTKSATEWLSEEDCDYQDYAGTAMWDLFRPRVVVEHAIAAFIRRHSFEDAA